MEIQPRSYRNDADLAAMRQLLIDGCRSQLPASYIHPGNLDWLTHNPPNEQQRKRNILLWEEGGQNQADLAAWAIFLPNEETFDLFVHPGLYDTPLHERVMDQYVAWAETRASEAGLKQLQPFWVLDYDTVMDRLMKARGFVAIPADPLVPLFERSLGELPTIQLPDGFTIQGVANLEDGQLRARVTYDAFGYTDWEEYWAAYAQFIGSAVYDGARDLLVRSPDGQGASACTIWFDAVNGVGLFEPVATHPDFQGRGLGKAVMAEGLRRMQAAGMQRAILGFDPNNVAALALYRSMGFQAGCYFNLYRKSLD